MDTFWHLLIGRWILDHHALPTENVWSAADPTQRYHAVQWLFEAVAAAIDRAWGLEGVRLVNAVWLTATFAGVAFLLRRRIEFGPLETLLWTLALLAVFQDRIRVRPHVINFTIEIALVFFVTRLPTARRWHALLFLPLFLLWAAVHAGGAWIFLACLCGLALATLVWEIVDQPRQFSQTLLLCVGTAAIGWLLNPESLLSLSTMAVEEIGYVREWRSWPALGRSVSAMGIPGFVIARLFPPAALLALAITTGRWWRRIRPSVEDRRRHGVPFELILSFFFVFFAFYWVRYFYLAWFVLLLSHVAWRRQSATLRISSRPATRRTQGLTAVVSLGLAAVIFLYEGQAYPSWDAVLRSRTETVEGRYFPVMTTQLLVESSIEARVATLPNWGGYVGYYGFPRLRTTVDGRFVAPPNVLTITRAIVEILEGRGDPALLHQAFSALPADFVLMRHPTFPPGAPHGEWILVAETPNEELYIRSSALRRDWVDLLQAVVERQRELELRRE